jgi:hypothetical protein
VCIYVYSVFVLSCVYVAALRRDEHSPKESYSLWIDQETEKWTGPARAIEPFKKENVGADESSRMRGSISWLICLVNHHITGHLMFVLVSTQWVMMCPTIDKPASCEIRAVIHFLHTRKTSSAEIHRELCAAKGENVMSEWKSIRQWCGMFTMKSEVVGHL